MNSWIYDIDIFHFQVDLPKGSLVPRIPQKINYVLHIDDLIKKNDLESNDKGPIYGIDIGEWAVFPTYLLFFHFLIIKNLRLYIDNQKKEKDDEIVLGKKNIRPFPYLTLYYFMLWRLAVFFQIAALVTILKRIFIRKDFSNDNFFVHCI